MAGVEGRILKGADIAAFEHTPGGSLRSVQQADHGLGAFSVAMSDNPPGQGAIEHRHSCGEVFIVHGGRGIYMVGEEVIVAEPGDVVVVPAGTWHSFRSDGDTRLQHVAVFDSGHIDIEVRPTP
jgi:mannose-6-phosphate isomerase-like protein (cupin superfamily)